MKYFKTSSNLETLKYNYDFPLLALNKNTKEILYKNKFKVLEYIKSNKTQSINIDLELFDMDNINFDLDIKFYLGESSVNNKYNVLSNDTIFNANDETDSPWPGILIRATGQTSNYKNISYLQAKETFIKMNGESATVNKGKYQEHFYEEKDITKFPYVHYINHFEFSQNQRHTFPTTLFSSLTSALVPQRFIEARLYHCYIKQNGQYVRYLTPVQDIHGINGLYDHVSGRFFTTTCGDNFEAGQEI